LHAPRLNSGRRPIGQRSAGTGQPQPAWWVGQNYAAVFATDIVSALPPSGAQ
jgi:hypothetical protein